MTFSRIQCISRVLYLTLCSSLAIAQPDIEIVGEKQLPLTKTTRMLHAAQQNASMPSVITLLQMQLSSHAWSALSARAENQDTTWPWDSGKSVQLGMNQVPPLDQGQHGSCATFANAAAIDALLNQGDYISELCVLQLGNYLEKNGYGVSGWNGSMGPLVLHQMQAFGIVSQQNQRSHGCGGLTEYPGNSSLTPKTDISLSEYRAISEPLNDTRIAWTPLLDIYQVFLDNTSPDATLKQVTKALDAGDRLTFGVLLFSPSQGVAGAVGRYQKANDTWILTPDILRSIKNHGDFGGHEMIITGYDDNATAVDAQGYQHKGLLTLRNSWGSRIGNQGDFYMSYDYFKTLAIEVQRIRQLT
jgi:hypothetical protein